jgi:galactokinase
MTTTWSVPGRVNLIGEHVDYNGGRVLPFAIDRRTEVTISVRTDKRILVTSTGHGTVRLPAPLRPRDRSMGWERYVAAALWAFADATGAGLGGLGIVIESTVPAGAGLSSSAAVVCGVIAAANDLAGAGLDARAVAALARRAEQEYVGVPCGPMDQLAVMLSSPDCALLLDTSSLAIEQVPFELRSAGLALLVVDTKVRHALDDGAYADRRAECLAAAASLGLASLADASLTQTQALTDPVLRRRACHVVSEMRRVDEVVTHLRAGRLAEVGDSLTASHRSLVGDFEVSCRELDLVVEVALAAGALGARMTGAGFGGSAIALCRRPDADRVATQVIEAFRAAGYEDPEVWRVSPSPGARRLPPRSR